MDEMEFVDTVTRLNNVDKEAVEIESHYLKMLSERNETFNLIMEHGNRVPDFCYITRYFEELDDRLKELNETILPALIKQREEYKKTQNTLSTKLIFAGYTMHGGTWVKRERAGSVTNDGGIIQSSAPSPEPGICCSDTHFRNDKKWYEFWK